MRLPPNMTNAGFTPSWVTLALASPVASANAQGEKGACRQRQSNMKTLWKPMLWTTDDRELTDLAEFACGVGKPNLPFGIRAGEAELGRCGDRHDTAGRAAPRKRRNDDCRNAVDENVLEMDLRVRRVGRRAENEHVDHRSRRPETRSRPNGRNRTGVRVAWCGCRRRGRSRGCRRRWPGCGHHGRSCRRSRRQCQRRLPDRKLAGHARTGVAANDYEPAIR